MYLKGNTAQEILIISNVLELFTHAIFIRKRKSIGARANLGKSIQGAILLKWLLYQPFWRSYCSYTAVMLGSEAAVQ